MARGFEFWIKKKVDCTFYVAKTNVMMCCVVTVHLIYTFVFAHAENRFFNGVAHIRLMQMMSKARLLGLALSLQL